MLFKRNPLGVRVPVVQPPAVEAAPPLLPRVRKAPPAPAPKVDLADLRFQMLGGMRKLSHVYAGTADPKAVAARRARNRAAGQSRRINRRSK